ncbi:hypothetical protein [Fluviispira multicolorata]|uniref:Uncharacterized protein n=1 Tax=Fluviispira multicolorata TaxID=2654512 RepID=A0A833JFC8_9BACT|nr:hypothetical protein [Fluviispira multicolorata]KAB8033661.1 hypothetical protein GCL57_02845 [Fluviispira multicolorata]
MLQYFRRIKHLSLHTKIFILSIGSVLIAFITSIILATNNFNLQENFLKEKLLLVTQDLSKSIQEQYKWINETIE